MRVRLIGVVAAVLLLLPLTPAQALVCVNSSVSGTYVLTIGGIDAAGNAVSTLAVGTFSNGDANGNGTISGTAIVNARGSSPTSQALSGNYEILANCFITIRLQEQIGTTLRINGLTGFVSQSGALIIFASPFDGGVWLTGNAVLVPF